MSPRRSCCARWATRRTSRFAAIRKRNVISCHAGDVAAAFVASLELRGVQDAANCACGETTTIADLALAAMRAAGRERPLRTSRPPAGANAGVKVRRATAARLHRLLPGLPRFRPVALGMRETVDWYRDALR